MWCRETYGRRVRLDEVDRVVQPLLARLVVRRARHRLCLPPAGGIPGLCSCVLFLSEILLEVGGKRGVDCRSSWEGMSSARMSYGWTVKLAGRLVGGFWEVVVGFSISRWGVGHLSTGRALIPDSSTRHRTSTPAHCSLLIHNPFSRNFIRNPKLPCGPQKP